MSLKINDNIDLPNSITAHNRIALKSVSVGGGGASPELIARVAKLERTVTKQQGAIEEMDRDLDGVHDTLESVGTDISELDTSMTAAEGEIDAIHSKNAAQDAVIATKQDQLTFDATPTEDSGNPVTSDGIFKSLADVIEIAEGKTSSFTLSAQMIGNEEFNSQAGSIEVASFTDVNGDEIAANELKIGDIILVTELDVPDRWVGIAGETVTLYRMETAKVDLSGYETKSEHAEDIATLQGNIDAIDQVSAITYSNGYTALSSVKIGDTNYRLLPLGNPGHIDDVCIGAGAGSSLSSVAIGRGARASGWHVIAIGNDSNSSGGDISRYGSVAIGINANASSTYAIALGNRSSATKKGAIAIGVDVHNNISNSIQFDDGTISHTVVLYNPTSIFFRNESVKSAGNLSDYASGQTLQQILDAKLNWANVPVLTQAEYDAMPTHDSNTFYFIPEEE